MCPLSVFNGAGAAGAGFVSRLLPGARPEAMAGLIHTHDRSNTATMASTVPLRFPHVALLD